MQNVHFHYINLMRNCSNFWFIQSLSDNVPIISIFTDLVAEVTLLTTLTDVRSKPEGFDTHSTLTPPQRSTQGKDPTTTTGQTRAVENDPVTSAQRQGESSTATTAALKTVSSWIQYAGLTNISGTIAVANSTETAITKTPLPRRQGYSNQQHQNGNSFNHTDEKANSLSMSDPVVIQNKNVAIVIAIIIIIFTGLYLKFGRR